MPLHIIENDITKMEVDAIVNSTNEELVGYSGVDRIIHELGGKAFEDECDKYRNTCVLGESIYTNAYNLPCRYLIHTICPIWDYGYSGDEAILRSCYRKSLDVAASLGCESVAFPLISAGSMGFPITKALENAVTTISEYLALYEDMDVYLVLYGASATQIAESVLGGLDDFIAENLRQPCVKEECFANKVEPLMDVADEAPNFVGSAPKKSCKKASVKYDSLVPMDLDELVVKKGESFVDKLYRFMDEKGIDKPAQVYKRAGVSKATFSKLVSGGSKKPSLETAVGFAMALRLTYDEAVEFLASGGLALSDSEVYDIIVKYFLINQIYDTWEMDVQLLRHGCKTMFSSL